MTITFESIGVKYGLIPFHAQTMCFQKNLVIT